MIDHLIETEQIQRANHAMLQGLEVLERMKFRLAKQKQHAQAEIEANPDRWPPEKQQQHAEAIAAREDELRTMHHLLHACNQLATDQHHWRTHAFTHGMHYGLDQHTDPLNPTDEQLDQMHINELITIGYARTWQSIFPKLSTQMAIYMATYHPTEYIDLIYIATKHGH